MKTFLVNPAVSSVRLHPAASRRAVSRQQTAGLARLAALGLCLAMLGACGGGGSAGGGTRVSAPPNDGQIPDTPVRPRGVGDSYLFVSVADYYFGTREVGSRTSQLIEISNRGGDIYPLSNIRLRGDDAEEFSTGIYGDLVLNPAEAVRLEVNFLPITDGTKLAELAFDFDTIVQATPAQNLNEQRYYQGKDLERRGSYPAAQQTYLDYVSARPVTPNKQRASMRIPVLLEAATQADSNDARADGFSRYLAALDAREANEPTIALDLIDQVLQEHADSYIADDALYLRGYIQLMDQNAPAAAVASMQALRNRYPDSSYYDTALYGEALANVELGNLSLARSIYEDLKYRHTGIDAFGLVLPKDNLTSRLWFDRATAGLAELGTV